MKTNYFNKCLIQMAANLDISNYFPNIFTQNVLYTTGSLEFNIKFNQAVVRKRSV